MRKNIYVDGETIEKINDTLPERDPFNWNMEKITGINYTPEDALREVKTTYLDAPLETKEDMVNHPKHYTRKNGMECIDEIIMLYGLEVAYGFCVGSAHRYRYRVLDKWNPEEDMKKSDWYMKKAKELKQKIKEND